MKNRISGLNAIRCSSVLINVNSYTQGKEINNANTDWFQAVIWKTANLEGPAAVSKKQTKYERASALSLCTQELLSWTGLGSDTVQQRSLLFVHTTYFLERCKEMQSMIVKLESHPSHA